MIGVSRCAALVQYVAADCTALRHLLPIWLRDGPPPETFQPDAFGSFDAADGFGVGSRVLSKNERGLL